MLNYWNEQEIERLAKYYPISTKEALLKMFPGRTWSSILTKANKLSINKRLLWTPAEDALLIRIYDKVPVAEVVKNFEGRTYDSIIHRAQKLNLNSYDHPIWTDAQINYIKDNWKLYPDCILAEKIHKTRYAVKRKRNILGLHRQDKTQRTYENITKFVRGNIYQWKLDSMIACNYQCVITGSKEFEIHHKYPVNKILDIAFKQSGLEYKPFNDYSQKELAYLLDCFCEEQSKYPLGDCVRKDIHILFHHLYGQYDVNENQWEQFKQDYRDGIYDNYKLNVIA